MTEKKQPPLLKGYSGLSSNVYSSNGYSVRNCSSYSYRWNLCLVQFDSMVCLNCACSTWSHCLWNAEEDIPWCYQTWTTLETTQRKLFRLKRNYNQQSPSIPTSCSVSRAAIGGLLFVSQWQRTALNRKLGNLNRKLGGKSWETRRKFPNLLERLPNFLRYLQRYF